MSVPFRRITLATVVCLLLAALGVAQAPAAAPAPKLSKEQQLQLVDYAKDYRLAEQQIALIKVQLAAALVSQRQAAVQFNDYLNKLRTQLHAPAAKWDFDGSTLAFVPHKADTKTPTVASVPVKPAASKAGTSAAAK